MRIQSSTVAYELNHEGIRRKKVGKLKCEWKKGMYIYPTIYIHKIIQWSDDGHNYQSKSEAISTTHNNITRKAIQSHCMPKLVCLSDATNKICFKRGTDLMPNNNPINLCIHYYKTCLLRRANNVGRYTPIFENNGMARSKLNYKFKDGH